MKFLLDQDVYAATAAFLQALDHDVLTARVAGLSRATDGELLTWASQQQRIVVTRDRDHGQLVFARHFRAAVIYLRLEPSTLSAVHEEFARVLTSYPETQLQHSFVIVEPGRHRIRLLA